MIGVLEWPERSEKEKRCNSRWLRSSIAENMLLALLAVQERHLSLSWMRKAFAENRVIWIISQRNPRSMFSSSVAFHSLLSAIEHIHRPLVCSSLQLMCVAVVSSSMLVDPCPTIVRLRSAFVRFVKAWCERFFSQKKNLSCEVLWAIIQISWMLVQRKISSYPICLKNRILSWTFDFELFIGWSFLVSGWGDRYARKIKPWKIAEFPTFLLTDEILGQEPNAP